MAEATGDCLDSRRGTAATNLLRYSMGEQERAVRVTRLRDQGTEPDLETPRRRSAWA